MAVFDGLDYQPQKFTVRGKKNWKGSTVTLLALPPISLEASSRVTSTVLLSCKLFAA